MSRPINFTDTSVTKKPYVEIDGVEYEVQDGTYQGGTDLNANTFNKMQDELNVFRNLLNKNSIINISDYTTSLSGNYKGYKYQLKPNTIYTLTCNNNNVTMSGSWIYRVYNSDNTSICILQDGSITSQITKTTFTTTSDGYIYFAHLYGTQDKLNTFLNTVDIQIEEGTTATSFTPWAGYIVESGSNDNGSYIKYSDGTMICRNKKTFNIAANIAYGALFRMEGIDFPNFPVAFKDVPDISCFCIGINTAILANWNASTKEKIGPLIGIRPVRTDAQDYIISYIAIGRWK